jgi:hypothetical protein
MSYIEIREWQKRGVPHSHFGFRLPENDRTFAIPKLYIDDRVTIDIW